MSFSNSLTFHRLKSTDLFSFIIQSSNYPYINPKPHRHSLSSLAIHLTYPLLTRPRGISQLHSASYLRSLRRAFSRSKLLAYFNPDLTQFITLTYKINNNTTTQVLSDIKYLIKQNNRLHQQQLKKINIRQIKALALKQQKETDKKQKHDNFSQLKYIYILELQERGSIHVHMITNNVLETYKNKFGYESVKFWDKIGFSSVRRIDDFDENFKPYLYLFKYMYKTERAGSSFIHTSRNFDKIEVLDYSEYIKQLDKEHVLFEEDYQFKINGKNAHINKKYIRI
jgi:hypothetical protein